MNAINWKKLLLPNIPYLLFVYCVIKEVLYSFLLMS